LTAAPGIAYDCAVTARGRFIVIEGGEGAGKSRLQAALGGRLAAPGREVVLTREPGGTPLGERVRELVLAQRALDDALAELLLFEAARAHHVATLIRPALGRGATVICDRFTASSVAYQCYGRGLARETVEQANAIATGGQSVDVTLLLDVPVEAGLARREGAGAANHFDRETAAFHERVRAGYLQLASESPRAWRVLDASRPFDRVLEDAMAALAE
jgi:dTMP kinase